MWHSDRDINFPWHCAACDGNSDELFLLDLDVGRWLCVMHNTVNRQPFEKNDD